MVPVKKIIRLISALTVFFITACNPVSEDVSEPIWNSLHNSKPFQSEFYHSSDYRTPHNACDEIQCHGTDLTGKSTGAPSCYSCHDDQWTIFGINHTKEMSGYSHRSDVNDYVSQTSSNAGWYSSCKGCHGSSLDGFKVGGPSPNFPYRYSCKECHSGFTGSIPPPGHSKKREGAWHSISNSCSGAACHGSNGESGGTASSSVSGLEGHGPACSKCHDGSPGDK